jgi:transcriptional regulator with XRE-family HTH domain
MPTSRLTAQAIGSLIRNQRIKSQLTQREIARKLRVSQSLISKVERGVLQMTLLHFLVFADMTGIENLDRYFGREEVRRSS